MAKHILGLTVIFMMLTTNCSRPQTLTPQADPSLRLPGMPARTDTVLLSEPDGLIGVVPENTSGTFQLLDSLRVPEE
jgi:hypothetical protein